MTARGELGAAGERLAVATLEQEGYRICSRNLRLPPFGEIDIVAERDGVVALVEVRVRRGDRFGRAEASLSTVKQQRMRRAALRYVALRDEEGLEIRIDLIAITLDADGRMVAVTHLENVVEG